MIGTNNSNPRLRGVQGNAPVDAGGAPRVIIQVGPPLEMYPVQFNDERGVTRIGVAVKCGGQLYLPENGIAWAASLAPASEWFKKEWSTKGPSLTVKDPEAPVGLPTQDTVDVLDEPEAGK